MVALWRFVIWGLRGLALAIVLGLSALMILGAWTMHTRGIRLLGVQTGSMLPAIAVGDAIIVRPQKFADLAVGGVISYRDSSSMLVSHRIRSIDRRARTLVTQGDQNVQPDSVVRASQVVGRVVVVLPRLGRLTDTLHQPLGLIAGVYVPATICIVWQVRRLQLGLQQPYRLRAKRLVRL